MEKIIEFFKNIGLALVDAYVKYSDFIHSILPNQAGDLAEAIIDVAVGVALLKLIGSAAFHTREND